MLRVELLPAAHGDCILLSYGSPGRHVLIDAGTTPTWEQHLKPHLERRRIKRIELFVLTHIDADHIAGAIPMLEDPEIPVEIGEVWFNARPQLSERFLSVRQGERFSELITARGIQWNESGFDGKAVCVREGDLPVVELAGGLRLTVLSPTSAKLDRLAKVWHKEVTRHLLAGPSGRPRRRRFLARHPTTSTDVAQLAATKFASDSSVPNGSSIALLAEHGDASVLLSGDAHASVLCAAVKKLRAQRRHPDRLPVGALKVSHHGSRGNTSRALLEELDCRRYLISCNGDVHKLPDNEAIGRIIHHSAQRPPELCFNYHCPRTEAWDDDALRKRYRYRTKYGDAGFLRIDVRSR